MFYSFGKQGNEVSGAVMGTTCRIAPSIFILELPSRFMHFTIALKTLSLSFCYLYLYLKLHLYLADLCTCSQLLLFSLIKNIKTLQEMLFFLCVDRKKKIWNFNLAFSLQVSNLLGQNCSLCHSQT